jgi:hypothetical protein
MDMRTMIAALTLASGALGFATIGQAARIVDVEIGVAPPPTRVEVVPPVREGYVYEQGHYGWDGQQYVWIGGQFILDRPGHVYQPYVIEQRGERWHFRAGHWDDD